MKTQTPNGDPIDVKIYYSKYDPKKPSRPRHTEVVVRMGATGEEILSAKTTAIKGDPFSKRTGRKVVASKILSAMRSINKDMIFVGEEPYTKEVRRTVFRAICPEYGPKEKKG